MSWIYENFIAWIKDFINDALTFYGDKVNNIFVSTVEEALQNEYVISAEKFTVSTSLLLVGAMVLKIVIAGYMMETDYDSEADPFNLLVKVAQTVAVITNANWIFNWLFDVGKDFSTDIIGSSNPVGFTTTIQSIFNSNMAGWVIIMTAIIFVSTMFFSIVSVLRAAELIAMKLLFPYFALDLLSSNRERWNNFITAYVIAFFSYALQILFYMIALRSFVNASMGQSDYYMATIAWMYLAIKAPQFLEKYIYKSGISNVASGGLRMVVQTATMRGAFR